jgi:hypothetical protein
MIPRQTRHHDATTMNRRFLLAILLLLGLAGSLGSAWAQGAWRDLPPDERRQMRQQMRDHWQQMPPEDRERFRQERQERQLERQQKREAFQQMAPEDRSRLRNELRDRRQDFSNDFGPPPRPQRGGFGAGRFER